MARPKLTDRLINPIPAFISGGGTVIVMQKEDTMQKPYNDFSPAIVVTGKDISPILYLGSIVAHMAGETWTPLENKTLSDYKIMLR
jgi:hypothetical protein